MIRYFMIKTGNVEPNPSFIKDTIVIINDFDKELPARFLCFLLKYAGECKDATIDNYHENHDFHKAWYIPFSDLEEIGFFGKSLSSLIWVVI